jgi:hypothetical protein
MAKRQVDEFTKEWITTKALDVIARYDDGVLTLRALHYQLVALGMTNTPQHYARVKGAMIEARRDGLVRYETFSDHERETMGKTRFEQVDFDESIEQAKKQIGLWMSVFNRTRWECQPIVPEVWIEKKALQGIFGPICTNEGVALAPCKGYPSLTFLNDAANRFKEVKVNQKEPVVLYFGDYDASGEDIPRSIHENLFNDFGVWVEVRRIALMEDQVIELELPPAPTKNTDSRAANWDGLGQVELDAVAPEILRDWCSKAIAECFDEQLWDEMISRVEIERVEYRRQLKHYVNNELK